MPFCSREPAANETKNNLQAGFSALWRQTLRLHVRKKHSSLKILFLLPHITFKDIWSQQQITQNINADQKSGLNPQEGKQPASRLRTPAACCSLICSGLPCLLRLAPWSFQTAPHGLHWFPATRWSKNLIGGGRNLEAEITRPGLVKAIPLPWKTTIRTKPFRKTSCQLKRHHMWCRVCFVALLPVSHLEHFSSSDTKNNMKGKKNQTLSLSGGRRMWGFAWTW